MKHEASNKFYSYHEKHGAWVIHRCSSLVNLTGGSHFEPHHFATESALIAHLDAFAQTMPKPDHNCHDHIEYRWYESGMPAYCSHCKKKLSAF
jgi:hypothetical protein